MSRTIRLIVNPSAGGGRALKVLPAVEARLREVGVPFTTVQTVGLADGARHATQAAATGEISVVLSGDGLAGAVAGALADVEGAVMGVLPGGRGNDFCRSVGIPLDAVAAVDVVVTGSPHPIDLGAVGEHRFIGIASVGFDSDANRIANAAPGRLGKLSYVYGAIRALLAWSPARFTIEVDGAQRTFAGWTVAAANGRAYGAGMFLAPDASLRDGVLDVVTIAQISRVGFARALPKVFKGRHLEEACVDVVRGREVRVSADRPFTVFADGDPVADLPVTIRAMPRALRVLLPRPLP